MPGVHLAKRRPKSSLSMTPKNEDPGRAQKGVRRPDTRRKRVRNFSTGEDMILGEAPVALIPMLEREMRRHWAGYGRRIAEQDRKTVIGPVRTRRRWRTPERRALSGRCQSRPSQPIRMEDTGSPAEGAVLVIDMISLSEVHIRITRLVARP